MNIDLQRLAATHQQTSGDVSVTEVLQHINSFRDALYAVQKFRFRALSREIAQYITTPDEWLSVYEIYAGGNGTADLKYPLYNTLEKLSIRLPNDWSFLSTVLKTEFQEYLLELLINRHDGEIADFAFSYIRKHQSDSALLVRLSGKVTRNKALNEIIAENTLQDLLVQRFFESRFKSELEDMLAVRLMYILNPAEKLSLYLACCESLPDKPLRLVPDAHSAAPHSVKELLADQVSNSSGRRTEAVCKIHHLRDKLIAALSCKALRADDSFTLISCFRYESDLSVYERNQRFPENIKWARIIFESNNAVWPAEAKADIDLGFRLNEYLSRFASASHSFEDKNNFFGQVAEAYLKSEKEMQKNLLFPVLQLMLFSKTGLRHFDSRFNEDERFLWLIKRLIAEGLLKGISLGQGFRWPQVTKIVQVSPEKTTGSYFEMLQQQSPLKVIGYRVGETSPLTENKRQQILSEAYLRNKELETKYGWGSAGTPERLKKIAYHIASNIKRHKNNANHSSAIDHWINDLAALKKRFYDKKLRIRFDWPD